MFTLVVQTALSQLERTTTREASIKAAGYKVINQWDCEWAQTLRENEKIRLLLPAWELYLASKSEIVFSGEL
jgi:G:T-mismatch repair DNA endonuclease (very short patch repair protein)